MYSQGDEERFIVEWFGERRGRFLDVGASDGVKYSNTRRLVELGWAGVLIEPNPVTFAMLIQNCESYQNLILANVALAAEPGLKPLWISIGDWFGISSLDAGHAERWQRNAGEHGTRFEQITVNVATPENLLAAFPGPYQFVTIDAEDLSWQITRAMPWASTGTELICIEVDHGMKREQMDEFMLSIGYARVYGGRGGNIMYGNRR